MAAPSRQVQVVSYPEGEVGPEHFEVVSVDVPDPGAGQVLVRNTWTSVDPGLRLRLRAEAPAGYFASFPLGSALDGVLTVGQVIASNAEGFEVGDTVWHPYGWREHAVVDAGVELMNGAGTMRVLDVADTPPQWYLGPLGAIGLTAYSGLAVADALGGGETLWVSAAAGAVGSLVAQMGVRLGHRVIASAGSAEKVAWLVDEVGVAGAFDYHREQPARALERLAPDGIDVYFDNVGGDHLEAALDALRMHGRVALCGSISDYEGEPTGPRNIFLATAKHLTLSGFRGSLHMELLDEMQSRLGGWLREGSVTHRETVYAGLDQAPVALQDMLSGRTSGKTLVRL
ncbi:NADP-dependent oxidoreductase [Nocardioides eburneiflavus]|uniref:NADP-dependent oxidoreductase n=1 Tax=Nocardioides eburneiflavus TaxID=2518372 RepID=A0A4Z1CHB9_9ACTN|nr:NADP-dependent oxidoreductase [Nocardioides eburneiflavus]TGN66045.1 NADP-dependent oxidoreductase [Nocardioides eburneiflavus]